MPSIHDDGLHRTFYADYTDEDELKAAERDLYASSVQEQQADQDGEQQGEGEQEEADDTEKPKFLDLDFDASPSSLYRNPYQPPRGALPADMVEWHSASEKQVEGMDTPSLFGLDPASGAPRDTPSCTVVQGALKDNWFVGACAVIATKPWLVHRLLASKAFEQNGMFSIRFYKAGLPRFVHVDDRLPCNRSGSLHYGRTLDPNEVWLSIVEKAYAKLHGSYENISYGSLARGLRDLTGWSTHRFALSEDDGSLWDELHTLMERAGRQVGSQADAGSTPVSNQNRACVMGVEFTETGSNPGDGILAAHAYAVLDMREVHCDATADFDAMDVRMVKVLNPWGVSEWLGDWRRGDPKWGNYPALCEALGVDAQGANVDSEETHTFWMGWDDLVQHFTSLTVALDVRGNVSSSAASSSADSEEPVDGDQEVINAQREAKRTSPFVSMWELANTSFRFRGHWIPGDPKSGSGGCPEHVAWPQNPQYAFEVDAPTHLSATLASIDGRFQNVPERAKDVHQLGMVIMALSGTKIRSTKYHPLKVKGQTAQFQVCSSASLSCTLQAGRYAIVPSLWDPNPDTVPFVLEVCTSQAVQFENTDDDIPDAGDLEESDDEDLGLIQDLSIKKATKEEGLDPENEGKELEALAQQAGELAHFLKSIIGDIRGLEKRVDDLVQEEQETA